MNRMFTFVIMMCDGLFSFSMKKTTEWTLTLAGRGQLLDTSSLIVLTNREQCKSFENFLLVRIISDIVRMSGRTILGLNVVLLVATLHLVTKLATFLLGSCCYRCSDIRLAIKQSLLQTELNISRRLVATAEFSLRFHPLDVTLNILIVFFRAFSKA